MNSFKDIEVNIEDADGEEILLRFSGTYTVEDVGIGSYEYWGAKGVDSRMAITEWDFTSGEIATLDGWKPLDNEQLTNYYEMEKVQSIIDGELNSLKDSDPNESWDTTDVDDDYYDEPDSRY
jgi:hypothetical protein